MADKYNLGNVGGMAVTELWSGSVGSLTGVVDKAKITLNDEFTNYKFLVFDFQCSYNGNASSKKYYSKVISVQQFINLFNNEDATTKSISFNWGYSNLADYFEIYKDSTSTTKVLNTVSNYTQCTRIVGIN